jgi:hypothetical protein
MALSRRSPSSRVSMQRRTGPGRWLRTIFTACPTGWLVVRDDWWFLRRSTASSSRSFIVSGLGTLSCVLPLLARHGCGITCWRGLLPILKPNRIICKHTYVNCSSLHLRVFLGSSNPQGQRQTSTIFIPRDNFGERKDKFNIETSRTTQMQLYRSIHIP